MSNENTAEVTLRVGFDGPMSVDKLAGIVRVAMARVVNPDRFTVGLTAATVTRVEMQGFDHYVWADTVQGVPGFGVLSRHADDRTPLGDLAEANCMEGSGFAVARFDTSKAADDFASKLNALAGEARGD